jgi:DMSO reductase anchor subunit
VPFTIAFIVPTNNKLIEKMNSLSSASLDDKAVESDVAEAETTHALLDKWATLNLARAVLVGAGALCAAIAAVDKRENVTFGGVGFASGANRM